MTDTDIARELGAIKAALGDWPGAMITGGQLSSLLHDAAPNLDVRATVGILKGPGAVAAFAKQYMSELLERIGKQGADVLYLIKGRDPSNLPEAVSAQIWQAFVSPGSPKHLVFHPASALLAARDDAASVDAGEVEIAKASIGDHDRIRSEFTASLPAAAAGVLKATGASDGDFQTWIDALRNTLPEIVREWGQFRRRHLAELFETRIQGLGLEPQLQLSVMDQVKAAERAAYSKLAKANELPRQTRRSETRPGSDDRLERARRVAHAAVDLMSLEELRAIQMPLGAMLDADRD